MRIQPGMLVRHQIHGSGRVGVVSTFGGYATVHYPASARGRPYVRTHPVKDLEILEAGNA